MSTNPTPRRWPLLLAMAGALAAMTGTTAVFITHARPWRYLVASGCFLQFLGFTLRGRRRTGGAR